MPFRPCIDCGELTRHGSRCEAHSDGTSWNGTRDRSKQATFRRQVLARYDNRCAATEHGERCPATTDLQAHHLTPGSWDPADGVPLCREHHRAIDKQAR